MQYNYRTKWNKIEPRISKSLGTLIRECTFWKNCNQLLWLWGHSITITWTRWGGEGVKKCLFLSTLRVKKLSTQGRGGVKQWQNSVHVVVECPLRSMGLLSRNVALQNQPTLENRVYKTSVEIGNIKSNTQLVKF